MGIFTEEVEKTVKNGIRYIVTCFIFGIVLVGLSAFIIYIAPDGIIYLSIPISIMAGCLFLRAYDTYKEITEDDTKPVKSLN